MQDFANAANRVPSGDILSIGAPLQGGNENPVFKLAAVMPAYELVPFDWSIAAGIMLLT